MYAVAIGCRHERTSILPGVLLLVVLAGLSTGCVRRRLFVNSNPPGALVYVDNQQIGRTPCAVDFTYYGTREIRLVKPGYETLTVNQPIPTPWYEFPPLDFVSENLVPTKIRDNRNVTYNLMPQVVVPTGALIDRANQLRQQTVVPAAAELPPGLPNVLPSGPPVNVLPPVPGGTGWQSPGIGSGFAPGEVPAQPLPAVGTPSVLPPPGPLLAPPTPRPTPIVSPPLR